MSKQITIVSGILGGVLAFSVLMFFAIYYGANYLSDGEVLAETRDSGSGSVPGAASGVYEEDLTMRSLDGKTVELSDFSGEVVFFNIWATWCGPCRAEMPSIQKLYDQTGNKGVKFVLLSNEDPEQVRRYISREGYTFPVYTTRERLPRELSTRAIPTTYIINRNGEIAKDHVGATNWAAEQHIRLLEELL